MNLIEIKLAKCTVMLTTDEIASMLQSHPETYKKALARGKTAIRANRFEAPRNPREGQI
jgi:DNA-directed RNA polymerase specialized sigma24 family protein